VESCVSPFHILHRNMNKIKELVRFYRLPSAFAQPTIRPHTS
jgi:hypothetical protein